MTNLEPPVSLASVHLFADLCEELLRRGKSVVTVEPIEPSSISVGDIVLYRQDKSVVAHRVVRIDSTQPETPPPCMVESHALSLVPRHSFVTRDDTWGKEKVLVTGDQILGKVVSVERKGREVDPYSRKAKLRLLIHTIGSRLKRLF